MEGGYQVLVDLWLMLGVWSLNVLGSCETMIWKKERSRIRVVQIDKIRSLLSIRRTDRILKAWKRELCGMAKGGGGG